MYLTPEQRKDAKFMAQNSQWLSNVQRAIKSGSAPVFVVSGPQEIQCRMRPKGSVENVAMIGDEQFVLNSVFREPCIATSGETIKVTLAPVVGKSADRVMAIAMQLSDVVNCFDGLEAWLFDETRWNAELKGQKKANRGELPDLPTAAEARASESWGSW